MFLHVLHHGVVVKQFIARYGADQVEVVVTLEDGSEAAGDLRAWEQLGDDSWRGIVTYRDPADGGNHLAWFPAERIREDLSNHSRGRSPSS